MRSYIMGMRLYFHKVSLFFQIFDDRFSCFIAIHSRIFSALFIDRRIIVHDVDLRQIVAFSNLKVIRVMCRRDLHGSGSEFFVYIIIRNNRNLFVYKRKQNRLAYNIFIPLVIRMYCDRGIPEHRLRTCRRDLKETVCSDDRIFDMPEMSVLFLVLYFRVGQGRLADRTPVDDPGSFVNISFFIQLDEHFFYRFGTALVHRETLSVPVTGNAQLFQLSLDRSRVLLFPLPCTLQKSLASQFFLIDSLFFELVRYFYFR